MGRALRLLVRFVTGFAAGMALGYVSATLFAPREGAESRALLHQEAGSLGDRRRAAVGGVQARVDFAMAEARRAAAETRAEIEATAGIAALPPDPDAEAGVRP